VKYQLMDDLTGSPNHERINFDQDTMQPGGPVEATIYALRPGEQYWFAFATVSNKEMSAEYELPVKTRPILDSLMFLVDEMPRNNAIRIGYTPTPPTISRVEKYRFTISDPQHAPIEKSSDDMDRQISFHKLTPGQLYNFSMVAISNDMTSSPINRSKRLKPKAIDYVEDIDITNTSVSFRWNDPIGFHDAYQIEYIDKMDNPRSHKTITLEPRVTITNLRPNERYMFEFKTIIGYGARYALESSPFMHEVRTLGDDPPDSVNHHLNMVVCSSNTTTLPNVTSRIKMLFNSDGWFIISIGAIVLMCMVLLGLAVAFMVNFNKTSKLKWQSRL